jgi:hypothetical protein
MVTFFYNTMIILTANTDSTVVLTLSELSISTGNTYTLQLINESTNIETIIPITDISTNTDRYNEFVINADLDAGRYSYKAFDNDNVLCEVGICNVISDVIINEIVYTSQTQTTIYYQG